MDRMDMLFNKIIDLIQKEKEFKKSKKIFFGFLFLFVLSLGLFPFSFLTLFDQIKDSGFAYFVSSAINDFGYFAMFFKDFVLAIFSSFPIMGMFIFTINLILLLFTLKLFLYKKQCLIKYFLKKT
ncbi:MAG: hypothetical protein V1686_02905 [Patescibacteria group bacterium]